MAISLRKNTLWVFSGNISTNVLRFLFGIVLARLLLPEAFGIVVTISVFTGVLGLVSAGGMGEAIVQAKSVVKEDFNVVFTVQLGVCSFIFCILYMIAPYFSVYFNNEIYRYLLPVSAANFLVRPFVNVQTAILRRAMNFKQLSIINVINLVISSLSSIVLAWYGFDVWSLVFGGLIGVVAKMLLLFFVTDWQPRIDLRVQKAKNLTIYGAKNTTNQLIIYARKQLSNLMVSQSIGPGALGLFNKGDSLSQIPLAAIGGSAYQTVFRFLATVQDDDNKSRYLYLQTLKLVTLYTYPIYFGLLWMADPFLYLLYGENWLNSAFPLQVFSIVGLLRCLVIPSGAVVAARDRLKTDIMLQAISLFFLIIGIIAGGRWGLNGIIIGSLPSIIFYCFSSVILACNTLHLRIFDIFKAIMPSLKLSIAMNIVLGCVVFILMDGSIPYDSWKYFVEISALGAATYVICFLFFTPGGLKLEAKKWKGVFKRFLLKPSNLF